MPFDSDRTLAAVGALLIAIGFAVPFLGIVGIILLLIGMRGLADYFGDHVIFTSALWGFIFGIVGIIGAAVFLVVALFFGGFFFWSSGAVAGAFVTVILAVVLAFVFFILEAVYFRRSFDILRDRSGEGLFGTAGTLLLVGAVLVIIIVGFLLLFIAWLLVAVAFFSMRPLPTGVAAPTPSVPVPPSPPVSAPVGKRYCTNCGAENKLDAVYCASCGQKL